MNWNVRYHRANTKMKNALILAVVALVGLVVWTTTQKSRPALPTKTMTSHLAVASPNSTRIPAGNTGGFVDQTDISTSSEPSLSSQPGLSSQELSNAESARGTSISIKDLPTNVPLEPVQTRIPGQGESAGTRQDRKMPDGKTESITTRPPGVMGRNATVSQPLIRGNVNQGFRITNQFAATPSDPRPGQLLGPLPTPEISDCSESSVLHVLSTPLSTLQTVEHPVTSEISVQDENELGIQPLNLQQSGDSKAIENGIAVGDMPLLGNGTPETPHRDQPSVESSIMSPRGFEGAPFVMFGDEPDQVAPNRNESSESESTSGAQSFSGPNDFLPLKPEPSTANEFDGGNGGSNSQSAALTELSWWQQRVALPILEETETRNVTVQDLVYAALENSRHLRAISQDPLIQEVDIDIALSQFDPNLFAKSIYDDRVDPVGNTLTTGGLPFLKDNIWTGVAGVKRRTYTGADISVEQKLGFQNSNSRFFTPQDQGTAVLSLNFEQPLLRGSGQYYNRSQILIAETSTGEAWDTYGTQLQDELLNVVEAYWSLYAARAAFIQKKSVMEKGQVTLRLLEARQNFDAQAIQLAQARAAVRSREADLANAYRDVRNAQTEINRLVGWNVGLHVELVTSEIPRSDDAMLELVQLGQIALENRPELKRAVKETKIAAVQNQVASNQILPDLSLMFGTYVAGLAGDSNIGRAWEKQFVATTPGFSAGLNFEFPWRNRAARGRLRKAELELVKAEALVEQATIDIVADVQKAYWRVKSALEAIESARQSLEAAQVEFDQNVKRWETFAITEGDWFDGQAQSLVLDQLLLSQQKVFVAENVLTLAEKELKSAQVFLKRATGTLITSYPASSLPAEVLPEVLPVDPRQEMPEIQGTPVLVTPDSAPAGLAPNNSVPTDLNSQSRSPTEQPPILYDRDDPQANSNSNNLEYGKRFRLGKPANELDTAFGGFGWGAHR